MENWLLYPPVLKCKLLFTILAGIGVITISAIVHEVIGDETLIYLGGIIFISCLLRCHTLWTILSKSNYEVIVGTCIGINTPPLRRYQKVTVMDESGIESTLLLQKQARIIIGKQYRFYFKKNTLPILGNNFFDSSLSTDSFLGFEELTSTNL